MVLFCKGGGYLLKYDNNGAQIPDFESCATVAAMETEFNTWIENVCLMKFCQDEGIINDDGAKLAYQKTAEVTPKKFWIVTDEYGTHYYYFGTDIQFKNNLKQQRSNKNTAVRNKKLKDGIASINTSITEMLQGKSLYTTEQKNILQTVAVLEDGARAQGIKLFNEKYGTNIPVNATSAELLKESKAVDNSGILGIGKGTIDSDTVSGAMTIFVNPSDIWNKSSNKDIQTFSKQGITGDVMWGVITGKYNGNDEECRAALEDLAQKVNGEEFTEEQKKSAVKELSDKYGLNLDNSVTAEQITEVINNLQKYRYQQQVKNIAAQIMEEKINDQITAKLQEKLGPTLARWGIDFSFRGRNIIQDIKDIVRGTKIITFNQDKFLKGLQDQLEKKIAKAIEDKVYAKLDEASKRVTTTIDRTAKRITEGIVNSSVYRFVDTINSQLTTWTKNPESFTLAIADRLDAALKNPVGKIESVLNKLDAPFKAIGLDGLGLGTMFKEITQVYTKGYAEKIREVISPVLQKALAVTSTVRKAFQGFITAVNKLRDQAKALVEKWKNTVKDIIAQQTQRLVNELVKYVKLNIAGALGNAISGAVGGAVSGAVGSAVGSALGGVAAGSLRGIAGGALGGIASSAIGDVVGDVAGDVLGGLF